MHAKDFLVDDGSDGQAIEAVCEGLPDLDVVPPLALIVEAVDAIDGGTLVIAAQDEEVLGKFDLERQQQANGFQRLLPPILHPPGDVNATRPPYSLYLCTNCQLIARRHIQQGQATYHVVAQEQVI